MFYATAKHRSWRFVTRLGLLITMPFVLAATSATLHVPEFPGNHDTTEREGTNELFSVTHEFRSAIDPATGLPDPRGRPQHSPIVVSKLVDQSTTGFYQTLAVGQVLDAVIIDFYGPQQEGRDVLFFTIELARASIVSIEVEHDSEKYPDNEIRERVGFVYERITWTFHETGASTSATWNQSP